jgi:hypothetical protein
LEQTLIEGRELLRGSHLKLRQGILQDPDGPDEAEPIWVKVGLLGGLMHQGADEVGGD